MRPVESVNDGTGSLGCFACPRDAIAGDKEEIRRDRVGQFDEIFVYPVAYPLDEFVRIG